MRSLFALLLLFPLLMPCVGCGESRPDPRDRPDFVDDTDPDMAGKALPEGGTEAGKDKPTSTPEEKE